MKYSMFYGFLNTKTKEWNALLLFIFFSMFLIETIFLLFILTTLARWIIITFSCFPVPTWINKLDWIIANIRIPVKRGRLPRLRDDTVSLGEVSRQRVIEPRDGLVQSQLGLGELAGASASTGSAGGCTPSPARG